MENSSFELTAENKLRKLIVVGDRVLIRPKKQNERTSNGLYLPPGVQEKEKIQEGYIVKVGPGYPIPATLEEDEPWKEQDEKIKYIPLQAQEGDKAIFLLKGAHEIQFEGEKYFVVPQAAVLMLEREEDLFD
ncbi:MAG TPA: chaperonin [Cytophagales bacterium]|nr:chaperonin [Cytophagales bacterium]